MSVTIKADKYAELMKDRKALLAELDSARLVAKDNLDWFHALKIDYDKLLAELTAAKKTIDEMGEALVKQSAELTDKCAKLADANALAEAIRKTHDEFLIACEAKDLGDLVAQRDTARAERDALRAELADATARFNTAIRYNTNWSEKVSADRYALRDLLFEARNVAIGAGDNAFAARIDAALNKGGGDE